MSDTRTLWKRGYRYALALCGEPARAEDLLHDAWVASLRAKGPPEAGYLFRAIRTRWIDAWRREQRVPFEVLEHEPVSPARGPSQIADDRQSVAHALALLRPDEREVLFLAAVEGLTAREIGELTERPRGTVLSLLHRARHRVREALEPAQEVTG